MTYTWSQVEEGINEDILETYGSTDMYIDEYFDADVLSYNARRMSLDQFTQFFENKYGQNAVYAITNFFESMRENWDDDHTIYYLAEYIYNNLRK